MKSVKMMVLVVALMIGGLICSWFGYNAGINRAVTSNGWVETNEEKQCFVLEVNDQLYEWIIDEYGA